MFTFCALDFEPQTPILWMQREPLRNTVVIRVGAGPPSRSTAGWKGVRLWKADCKTTYKSSVRRCLLSWCDNLGIAVNWKGTSGFGDIFGIPFTLYFLQPNKEIEEIRQLNKLDLITLLKVCPKPKLLLLGHFLGAVWWASDLQKVDLLHLYFGPSITTVISHKIGL